MNFSAGENITLTSAVEGVEDDKKIAIADIANRKFSSNDVMVGIMCFGKMRREC